MPAQQMYAGQHQGILNDSKVTRHGTSTPLAVVTSLRTALLNKDGALQQCNLPPWLSDN
jgi:hypothetical protein